MATTIPNRTLRPGQACEVHVATIGGRSSEPVFSSDELLLEAPNWTHDGRSLILNGDGRLWSLDLETGALAPVPLTGVPDLNNDHVLGVSGDEIYVSANDGHIYRGDLRGGRAARVTVDDGAFHFLHGVSPDGSELAYVGLDVRDFSSPGRLFTMPAAGGPARRVDVGPGHCDGPEYSPDGEWIHLNTETFSQRPGHAQIARVRTDGSSLERLTHSETVDWFPHLSPSGEFAVYLRFPPGTVGHPADLSVEIVVVSTRDWNVPLERLPLPGGQGTINVNSWSPDSTSFAFVAYPMA